MQDVILVRYAEIHLKGLNRPFFERTLANNIKFALSRMNVTVTREQGRMYVWGVQSGQIEEAARRLRNVFGIHSICIARAVDKKWADIEASAVELMGEYMENERGNASFKVFSRRSDKGFPMTSEEINRELGHALLERFNPRLCVDVRSPQIKIWVEIRERAFVFLREIPCRGGMPTGTAGRCALLLSGGIDSPVAGYMLAKRGAELSAVHFYSYPYTSERAKDKVIELTRILSAYTGTIRLHLVPFTKIQTTIYEKCPPKETTVLMRRLMMRIAQRVAEEDGALALITGEALGQVASQTLESLAVTDDAVTMPVFRPLIGMDKEEITTIAKDIGTFETSILPYEDCCTVFVPQHPVTKPRVCRLRQSEAMIDFEAMIGETLCASEVLSVHI